MTGIPIDQLERIQAVMVEVQADCEIDAMSLDGKPFDGRTVAEQFGRTLAAVKAVAHAVEVLVADLVEQEQP